MNWLKRLLFKEEDFDAELPSLCIKLDQIPNPTKEERIVSKLSVKAHRTTARCFLAKPFLRIRFKEWKGGTAGLTEKGRVLETYSIPAETLL